MAYRIGVSTIRDEYPKDGLAKRFESINHSHLWLCRFWNTSPDGLDNVYNTHRELLVFRGTKSMGSNRIENKAIFDKTPCRQWQSRLLRNYRKNSLTTSRNYQTMSATPPLGRNSERIA